jgi:oxidase EvaA
LEGKFEPGNYGEIQISPTLQATYSNLNKLHGGRAPRFLEYFDGTKNVEILYEQWLPEDGGRFYKKRVKNMLVKIASNEEIMIPFNFIWMTMRQIKEFLRKDNIINPHVRSIIAHL